MHLYLTQKTQRHESSTGQKRGLFLWVSSRARERKMDEERAEQRILFIMSYIKNMWQAMLRDLQWGAIVFRASPSSLHHYRDCHCLPLPTSPVSSLGPPNPYPTTWEILQAGCYLLTPAGLELWTLHRPRPGMLFHPYLCASFYPFFKNPAPVFNIFLKLLLHGKPPHDQLLARGGRSLLLAVASEWMPLHWHLGNFLTCSIVILSFLIFPWSPQG